MSAGSWGAAVVHIHTRAADGKWRYEHEGLPHREGIRAHKDRDVIHQLHLLRGLPEHPATDEGAFCTT